MIAWLHYEPDRDHTYLKIQAADNYTLFIDQLHKLPVNGVVLQAGRSRIGDVIDTPHGTKVIQSISHVVEKGIFTLATYSSLFYVDNTSVSTLSAAAMLPDYIEDQVFLHVFIPYFYLRYLVGLPFVPSGIGPIDLADAIARVPFGMGALVAVFLLEPLNCMYLMLTVHFSKVIGVAVVCTHYALKRKKRMYAKQK